MTVATYKGFSTVGNDFGTVKLTDQDLIKRDLLNHFAIRKGEKLMNGNFGTSLQDLIMEPLTEQTKNAILVDEYQYGLQVEMSITYSNNNQTENLLIRFNRTDGTVL